MLWRHWLGGGNAKLLKKVLYVYDVQRHIWFWYKPEQELFHTCDQMSEKQFALPTLVPRTAIVGVRNIYDYPDVLLELQETFKRSLNFPQVRADVKELSKTFSLSLKLQLTLWGFFKEDLLILLLDFCFRIEKRIHLSSMITIPVRPP